MLKFMQFGSNILLMVVVASIVMTAGIVKAAGMTADWLRVGTQGEGGVTYFNSTIINDTTGDNDANNPVTFGDNVRIDGRVYRGATAGTADTLPFIVNDNMEVTGTLGVTGILTVGGLSGTGIVSSDNIADGVVVAADLASNSITSAKITDSTIVATDIAAGAVTQTGEASGTETQITFAVADNYDFLTTGVSLTTGDSTALVMFSGVLANDTDNSSARVFLVVDNGVISHTIRRGTSNSLGEVFTLSFTALVDVDAGDHTFHVGWNTDAGTTASLYNYTLDVVELKK
jgi:hypothetical protein